MIDENGREHKPKFFQDSIQENPVGLRRRRVVDIAAVTDVVEARNLLASGWEYKISYPTTISNIPHYILVKRSLTWTVSNESRICLSVCCGHTRLEYLTNMGYTSVTKLELIRKVLAMLEQLASISKGT